MRLSRARRVVFENLAVFTAAFALYAALYSDLPIDDTARFTADIAAGRYQWQATHLLMQPTAVLWHKSFSFGSAALSSQKRINTFSAALALAIFIHLLRRLGVSFGTRALVVAIAALSFSVLNLATSGHIKMTSSPFLTLALYHAVLLERRIKGNRGISREWWWHLAASAVALAVASLFLISSLVVAPFLCLAIFVTVLQFRRSWRKALHHAGLYGLVCGLLVLAVLMSFYLALSPHPHDLDGFGRFVTAGRAGQEASRFSSANESVSRVAYGTTLNFVYCKNLGPVLRARINGNIGSLRPYVEMIAWESVISFAMFLILGWTYVRALVAAIGRSHDIRASWGFLLGALAFAAFWNLSEAEFYFQATLPTLLMAALIGRGRSRRLILMGWLLLAVISNVGLYAIPKKAYPFQRYAAELQRGFTTEDLILCFEEYPGEHCMQFFLPCLEDKNMLVLDRFIKKGRAPAELYGEIQKRGDACLLGGGRAVIFRALDPRDWNAPWPTLLRAGVTKEELRRYLEGHFEIAAIGEIAEIPCWELRPLSSAGPSSLEVPRGP
jgi:hypothetical protein